MKSSSLVLLNVFAIASVASVAHARPQPPAERLAECDTAVGKADPKWRMYAGHENLDMSDASHTGRIRWLTASTRSNFVTMAKKYKSAQAGAPMLLLDCTVEPVEKKAMYFVMGLDMKGYILDGQYVVPLPADAKISVPDAPQPPAFAVNVAYNRATPDDYAAVKGAHDLMEKRGKCEDSGIAASQAAGNGVTDGPNYDERRKDAGAGAHSAKFDKCFGPKLQKQYETYAQQLWDHENARDAAFYEMLKAKFK